MGDVRSGPCMMRSAGELVEVLGARGFPWSDARVRAQDGPVLVGLWRRHLPEVVAGMVDLEVWPARVSRQDLLDQAQLIPAEIDPDALGSDALGPGGMDGAVRAAVSLFVRVCVWGAGSKARAVWRCCQPLQDPAAPAKLVRARQVLLDTGPVDAYRSMRPDGVNHLHGLGAAFFTKWLYFCSYPAQPTPIHQTGMQAALILDARVATTLQHHGLRPSDYQTYVDLADDLAAQFNAPTHAIEHALFQLGTPSRTEPYL